MVCISPPDATNAVSRCNKLIWLLVGSWLATAFVSVAQADDDDASAAYARGDYDTAIQQLKPLAEQGNAEAQSRLGWMYENGEG